MEAGPLIACFGETLTCELIEQLGAGIIAWADAMAAKGPVRVVLRDSGFSDDVAKMNIAAILDQNGITELRAL